MCISCPQIDIKHIEARTWLGPMFRLICLTLHAVQLLHDVLLPALAPETADDSGQLRRSWSLGRDKTKKGKVSLQTYHACIRPLPQAT